MDFSAILEWIPTILGSIGGISGITALMYRRQTEESKNLDNDAKKDDINSQRSEEWHALYDVMKQERDNANNEKKEIEKEKGDIIKSQEERICAVEKNVAKLTVKIAALESVQCWRYTCPKRVRDQYGDNNNEEKCSQE